MQENRSSFQGDICLQPLLKTERDGKVVLGEETGAVKTFCGAGS